MFASKKSVTLLVVNTEEVLRVDATLGARPKIKSLHRERRPPQTPLAAAVELAIGLIPAKPSRQSVVLAEEAWTGILDIDERSIYGLQGEELNQMLRFESESLSDLDPMSSRLMGIELATVPPDTRRFWCTAVSAEMLQSVVATVQLRGGKLACMGHPIGWAGPAEGQSWVEFRRSIAGAFSAGSTATTGGFPRASIAPRSATSDRWYRSLQTNYGGDLPAAGWLTADAGALPDPYSGELHCLESDEVLRRWAEGVLLRLARPESVPAVTPPVPPVSSLALAGIATAAAATTVLACSLHFYSFSRTQSDLRAQLEALQQPAFEKKQIESEIKQLRTEITTQQKELDDLQQRLQTVTIVTERRDRYAELLRLLATLRNENIVVDKIVSEKTGLRLSGRTIDADAAMRLSVQLTPQLNELGWKVQVPQMEGENQLVNGGPWTFQVELTDAPIPPMEAGSRQETVVSNVAVSLLESGD